MTNLVNLTYPELEDFVTTQLKEKPFRALQIWQWLWQKQVINFDNMTTLSLIARAKLKNLATIELPKVIHIQTSKDGTKKFLLKLSDNAHIETVIIPAQGKTGKTRITQCLSSQVGCPMGCKFCNTATMGFIRNLTAGEILGQIITAKIYLNDHKIDNPIIKNLVFMGMGEPLLNTKELTRALQILHSEQGLNFSSRRITVSTCGIKKGLQEFSKQQLAFIALSLHAPNQGLRSMLMPKAAKWNLEELMYTLQQYPLQKREYITFEYLLLNGINDSPNHAKELAKLVSHVKGKINLIPYNPSQKQPYTAPTEEALLAFEKILWSKGITTIVRKSRGQDIEAACGQLCILHKKSQLEKNKKTILKNS